jgi:hypothetical protein
MRSVLAHMAPGGRQHLQPIDGGAARAHAAARAPAPAAAADSRAARRAAAWAAQRTIILDDDGDTVYDPSVHGAPASGAAAAFLRTRLAGLLTQGVPRDPLAPLRGAHWTPLQIGKAP